MLGQLRDPGFCAFRYDNWGANPSTTLGTSVTPATQPTEGTWTQVATSGNIAQDVAGIAVFVTTGNTTGTQRNCLLDIGVDPAGGTSYTAIINNVLCGQAASQAANGSIPFVFPIRIKAGSSVAVRLSASNASTFRVGVRFYGQCRNPLFPVGQYSETVGTVSAAAGVAFTPGNAADGTWVSLGTTTKKCWWWQVCAQVSSGNIGAQYTYVDLAWGDGSNKNLIMRTVLWFVGTAETAHLHHAHTNMHEGFCPVPAGATLYVRGRCNGAPTAGYTALAIGVG